MIALGKERDVLGHAHALFEQPRGLGQIAPEPFAPRDQDAFAFEILRLTNGAVAAHQDHSAHGRSLDAVLDRDEGGDGAGKGVAVFFLDVVDGVGEEEIDAAGGDLAIERLGREDFEGDRFGERLRELVGERLPLALEGLGGTVAEDAQVVLRACRGDEGKREDEQGEQLPRRPRRAAGAASGPAMPRRGAGGTAKDQGKKTHANEPLAWARDAPSPSL